MKPSSKPSLETVESFRKKMCSSSALHLSYWRSSFSFELPSKLSAEQMQESQPLHERRRSIVEQQAPT